MMRADRDGAGQQTRRQRLTLGTVMAGYSAADAAGRAVQTGGGEQRVRGAAVRVRATRGKVQSRREHGLGRRARAAEPPQFLPPMPKNLGARVRGGICLSSDPAETPSARPRQTSPSSARTPSLGGSTSDLYWSVAHSSLQLQECRRAQIQPRAPLITRQPTLAEAQEGRRAKELCVI